MMTEANVLVCPTLFYVVLYRPIKNTCLSTYSNLKRGNIYFGLRNVYVNREWRKYFSSQGRARVSMICCVYNSACYTLRTLTKRLNSISDFNQICACLIRIQGEPSCSRQPGHHSTYLKHQDMISRQQKQIDQATKLFIGIAIKQYICKHISETKQNI